MQEAPLFRLLQTFPPSVYRFEGNPVTEEGFQLGKKLFFDERLSANNTISCGSCHIPSGAFSHPEHPVSHGIHNLLGKRNAPSIMNLAWSSTFMWDGGIFDLDLQPLAPIANPVEMDESVTHVLSKLKADETYRTAFKKAFPLSDSITGINLLKALSQFMVMCISADAKYDSVMRKQGAVFTKEEAAGYVLFKNNCDNCHKEPLFTNGKFSNNGMSKNTINDLGRYAVTLNASDSFRFKVPSLRNLDHTGPYLHDGSISYISDILDLYTSISRDNRFIDTLLFKNGTSTITLSKEDKSNLLAFLKTLNDRKFITNPLLSP